MRLQRLARLAGALGVLSGLAGCMDVAVDVKVKNMAEAEAVMTQTISAQFYPTIKASMGADAGTPNALCARFNGGTLTENADGSATCTIVSEGGFANFSVDNGADKIDFTTPGPGLVRVAFPSRELTDGVMQATSKANHHGIPAEDANANGASSEMKQEMLTYFAGHFLTITFSGGEITDTNMTLAADRQSAFEKIPFVDLINGTTRLPDEIYAVVRLD